MQVPMPAIARTRPASHADRCARAAAMLALVGLLCGLPGCAPRHGHGAQAQASSQARTPLAWTVNAAHLVPRLTTASMETRQAAPGAQFVVLDVSVSNPDSQPRVLSEGTLVAMDESGQRVFDQPETLLSDDYLSLQVLAPSQAIRGKIAFEVPKAMPGVLFWRPGDSRERILLNLTTPMPARTFADADADADDTGAGTPIMPSPRTSPVRPARDAVDSPRVASLPRSDAPRDGHASRPASAEYATSVADGRRDVRPVSRATAMAAGDEPLASTVGIRSPALASAATSSATPARAAHTATRMPSTVSPARPEAGVPVTRATPEAEVVDPERARQLACAGLVARDDPAEKAANLAFFAQSCRDYALPARWRPPPAPRRSLLARASALVARVVLRPHVERISDCSQAASRADRLVCADPGLSAMDHRLSQAVTRARDTVDDPRALQREQAAWRDQRDNCRDARCLQHAYGRRIAQLDALATGAQ
ncbi:DUF4352 domain-containing protein [Cognatiluteimonas telluris]|uniref:DUF4352 domain-containing protein n=1 Tax=Cognatiluteimonas telluris TaxID=1104775 RepID=UPI00140C9D5D|nr:DUF4352 domain-containing protein [Lysobacter telluris]